MSATTVDVKKPSTPVKQHTSNPKAAKLVPFLRKLQILCENAPASVARWSADGKQFDVLDPKGFEDLLKVYFENSAPATFHRQLFFYGWVKLNPSNGGGDEKTKGTFSFRHPCFLRDEPSKIYEIKRFARASDRDEQEDGSRVDVLERRVSVLQSVVDDLSRKLAAVQLTLEKTAAITTTNTTTTIQPDVIKTGRKRVKDVIEEEDEDDLLNDFHLDEQELFQLFDVDPMDVDEYINSVESEELKSMETTTTTKNVVEEKKPLSQPKQIPLTATKVEERNTEVKKEFKDSPENKFLTLCMNTPAFHQALSSTIQDKKTQTKKVDTHVPSSLEVC